MDIREILSCVDHTLLAQDATWEQIKTVCDDGMRFGVASVCIPPSFVRRAKAYVGDKLPICTVIGFPNGYMTAAAKCAEAADAVQNGADEIDMVINVGDVKDGDFDAVLQEINAVKKVCDGNLLKVIIETCLLTEQEKIKLCEIVSASNADFIKTSTGFAGGGATAADIALMAAHVNPPTKIKAAGGISSFADARQFLKLGAHRLGTSRLVKLLKNEQTDTKTYSREDADR